jgi:YesN/AraC family two-component response regulator
LNLYNHLGGECTLPFALLNPIGYRPEIISLFQSLNEEWLNRSPGYQMKVRAYVLLILQRYFELLMYESDSAQIDIRIKKCIQYITSHYMEPITIHDLAKLTNLNHVYLGELFKRSTNQTFRQYLTYIRLNQAEDILRSGEYNVTETAMMCGFTDVFYFSKAFKENRGVAPSMLIRS